MNDFKNEIGTSPFGEILGSSATAAIILKRRAIERWENEGGKIPSSIKLVSMEMGAKPGADASSEHQIPPLFWRCLK